MEFKSTFLDKPRTQEELEDAYAKAYDEDYQMKQYEEHYPYSKEADKIIDSI